MSRANKCLLQLQTTFNEQKRLRSARLPPFSVLNSAPRGSNRVPSARDPGAEGTHQSSSLKQNHQLRSTRCCPRKGAVHLRVRSARRNALFTPRLRLFTPDLCCRAQKWPQSRVISHHLRRPQLNLGLKSWSDMVRKATDPASTPSLVRFYRVEPLRTCFDAETPPTPADAKFDATAAVWSIPTH